jgi:hypothetical protein
MGETIMRGHSTRSEDQIPEDRRPKGQAGHERREEEADVLVEDALLRLVGEDEDRFAYDAEKSGDGAGIYDASGNVKTDEIDAIIAVVDDPTVLEWEAPIKNQQQHLILRLAATSTGAMCPRKTSWPWKPCATASAATR